MICSVVGDLLLQNCMESCNPVLDNSQVVIEQRKAVWNPTVTLDWIIPCSGIVDRSGNLKM